MWTSQVNAGHFETGLVNSYNLRHTLSPRTSHTFLQGPALHLPWSAVWVLLSVTVFRGYCLSPLEDLLFWHGKEFAGHNHNSSLNILKAFKQVAAF